MNLDLRNYDKHVDTGHLHVVAIFPLGINAN